MSHIAPSPLEESSAPSDRTRRRFSMANVVVAAMLFAGCGIVLYPSASNWFNDRAHATEISGYSEEVAAANDSELHQLLQSAQEYNTLLPQGPLRDPFNLNTNGSAESVENGRENYEQQLLIGNASSMARIRVPDIGVDLPVYHGTSEEVLTKGVGHLYGSSLPIGGNGSHAVLTGHSGLPSAELFTDLEKLSKGDLFYVDVAGETLTYKIDQVLTVKPDDASDLRRDPGHDYVTLLTCTPTGVNTHRLLVRGERVADDDAAGLTQTAAPNSSDPGFPWWTLGLAGAAAVSGAVAWPRKKSTK